jgi:hypothetical protein
VRGSSKETLKKTIPYSSLKKSLVTIAWIVKILIYQ